MQSLPDREAAGGARAGSQAARVPPLLCHLHVQPGPALPGVGVGGPFLQGGLPSLGPGALDVSSAQLAAVSEASCAEASPLKPSRCWLLLVASWSQRAAPQFSLQPLAERTNHVLLFSVSTALWSAGMCPVAGRWPFSPGPVQVRGLRATGSPGTSRVTFHRPSRGMHAALD